MSHNFENKFFCTYFVSYDLYVANTSKSNTEEKIKSEKGKRVKMF